MTGLFTIKNWIFVQVQTKAGEYNRRLIWDNEHGFNGHKDCADHKVVAGTVLKETEKAIQVELYATYLNSYDGFEVIEDAEFTWKAWLPKSAVVEMHDLAA